MQPSLNCWRGVWLTCAGAGIVLSVASAAVFRTADGGAVQFAFQWLALPLLAVWLVAAFRPGFPARDAFGRVLAAVILTVFCCSVGGSGLLLFLNAGFGWQAPVLIQGPVISKSAGGLKGYPTLSVRDEQTCQVFRLQVSRREYAAQEVGQVFRQTMHRGALGIVYAPASNQAGHD